MDKSIGRAEEMIKVLEAKLVEANKTINDLRRSLDTANTNLVISGHYK